MSHGRQMIGRFFPKLIDYRCILEILNLKSDWEMGCSAWWIRTDQVHLTCNLKSNFFLNIFCWNISITLKCIFQFRPSRPKSMSTHQVRCAWGWSSHPQTCCRRLTCPRFRCPRWSHHPGNKISVKTLEKYGSEKFGKIRVGKLWLSAAVDLEEMACQTNLL